MQMGDVLVIYSDGVTEAQSPTGEEFGATRLYEVVSRNIEARRRAYAIGLSRR